MAKNKRLKKELSLLQVYALGTGTTLSAGFFLLPGMAAAQAGPAVIVAYLLAAFSLIPAMFSQMELSTAMPRAGGIYYFLDRSMGPLVGTIGGLGTWLSFMLKVSFVLIGMGAYINLFVSGDYIVMIAVAFTIIFGVINLIGAKESGSIQVILVAGILFVLSGFIAAGVTHIEKAHFSGFFEAGSASIYATAGLVFMSFAGVTKVASIAEEIKDPEKNIPLGMLLSFLTAIIVYGLGTYAMVGLVPMGKLVVSLTPVADAANIMFGNTGKILVTGAAICAFFSAANAGILSASRYPMAMSRDHLISKVFRRFSKNGVPINSVLLTVGVILFIVIFLNPMKIVKLASAFQLMVFGLCSFAVIIMRESHIEAYDPGFKSPFYPWMQIAGIIISLFLIKEIGPTAILFSGGLIVLGIIWYYAYARKRVIRRGAILHVFQRLGQFRHEGLEPELRGILKEKGLREEDPFDHVVATADVLELKKQTKFDDLFVKASHILSKEVSHPQKEILNELMEGTKVGGTPVERGAALPHLRLAHIVEPVLLIVRAKNGVDTDLKGEFWGLHKPEGPIYAVFFLVSPESNPKQHLRILAKIAEIVDDSKFMNNWLEAKDEQELRELLMREENFVALRINSGNSTKEFIGKQLKDIEFPEDTLVAIINRNGKKIVPKGDTTLKEGDRVTLIGGGEGVKKLKILYG